MATLSNSGVYYESGQAQNAFAAMTAAANNTGFSLTAKPWSQASGYEYLVVPYGLATGGTITPSAVANQVDVAALTAYMPGNAGADPVTGLVTVGAAAGVACARGAGAPTAFMTVSITVTNAGAIAAVSGTGSTSAVETRGAAGGPPYIPVGSIEIGQIRYTSETSAVVPSGNIYQVVGTHQERYDYPVWSEDPISGTITFAAALPTIHTADVSKKVYAKIATPIFAEISRAKDWVPAETSNTVNSEQYYDGPIGSVASSLGQASFTVSLNDGVTDALLAKKGQNLLFKFKPDKNKSAYQITQGILGLSRTFAVGTNPTATVTVSASIGSVDFAS